MKCKICGKEFECTKENHYIARDKNKTRLGLGDIGNGQYEIEIYDAFDCTHCGSQYLAQGRKRKNVLNIFTDCEETIAVEDEGETGLNTKDSIEDSTNESEEPLKTEQGGLSEECWLNEFDEKECIVCDNYDICKKIAEAGDKDKEVEEERPDCFGGYSEFCIACEWEKECKVETKCE